MLGVNFATETEKLELDGSARYNYKDADIVKYQLFRALPAERQFILQFERSQPEQEFEMSMPISVWSGSRIR